MRALAIASIVAVAVGLAPLPLGYYMLLRIVLCLAAAVGFAAARRLHAETWMWIYGVIAVVYNPVLPVHLMSKPFWVVVNLATLPFLWIGARRLGGARSGGGST